MDVVVFGGTREGRELVEWLDGRGRVNVVACTATAYGASLLTGGAHVSLCEGPLDAQQKRQLMETHDVACIVDATHPYALHISDSIAALGKAYQTEVVRIVRADPSDLGGGWTSVDGIEAAARHLAATSGPILLTTGSKGLARFAEVFGDVAHRVYVRVLPVARALETTAAAGIPVSHVIAMQGPFSRELNVALIREFGIEHLVTKQSGAAGGFEEKVLAARDCAIELVVVERPRQESGLSLEEAQAYLEERYGC